MPITVTDIENALSLLGGQASITQILEQVLRIAEPPLPPTARQVIRARLQENCPESNSFKGHALFRNVYGFAKRRGIWALRRDDPGAHSAELVLREEPARREIDATTWTGRPTRQQQTAIIRDLGPRALAQIDELLFEQDRRHDNGGPVAPEETAAIALLKELRGAIDRLISLAEADQPLRAQANRIKAIGRKAMSALVAGLARDAASVGAAGTPVILAGVTYALSQTMLDFPEAAAIMMGTAAASGPIAKRWSGRLAGK